MAESPSPPRTGRAPGGLVRASERQSVRASKRGTRSHAPHAPSSGNFPFLKSSRTSSFSVLFLFADVHLPFLRIVLGSFWRTHRPISPQGVWRDECRTNQVAEQGQTVPSGSK